MKHFQEYGEVITTVPADTTDETLRPEIRLIIEDHWERSRDALASGKGVILYPYRIVFGAPYTNPVGAHEVGQKPVGWVAAGSVPTSTFDE